MAFEKGTFSKANQGKIVEAMKQTREVEKVESVNRDYTLPEKVTISARVSPDVKERLQKEAFRHGMRLSTYLDYFLNKELPND